MCKTRRYGDLGGYWGCLTENIKTNIGQTQVRSVSLQYPQSSPYPPVLHCLQVGTNLADAALGLPSLTPAWPGVTTLKGPEGHAARSDEKVVTTSGQAVVHVFNNSAALRWQNELVANLRVATSANLDWRQLDISDWNRKSGRTKISASARHCEGRFLN